MSPLPLLALLSACDGPTYSSDAPARPQLSAAEAIAKDPATAGSFDINDPDSCVPCHATIVEEWRTSMHSRAATDPIYLGMVELHSKKQGVELANKCASCHSPAAPDDLSSATAQAGVFCVVCHSAASIDRSHSGAKALVAAPAGTLLGPHDLVPQASPVHGTDAAPAHMKDGSNDLCLACHDQETNANGVPTCTTGPENAGSASCRSCHMPRVSGPAGAMGGRMDHASHAFPGPRQTWEGAQSTILNQSLGLHGDITGDTLELRLGNLTGHALPTGFPGRVIGIHVVGKDATGNTVWQNWSRDPMQESPESVLNRVYGDEQGKGTMPPFATQQLRDNRLQPGETRVLHFDIPPSVSEVQVSASYRLMPSPAARKLGLKGDPLAQSRTLTTLTITR